MYLAGSQGFCKPVAGTGGYRPQGAPNHNKHQCISGSEGPQPLPPPAPGEEGEGCFDCCSPPGRGLWGRWPPCSAGLTFSI